MYETKIGANSHFLTAFTLSTTANQSREKRKFRYQCDVLVPMQSALNAWKIPTFADCFFNLCLFVLFENFGCKNLKHTIFEPLKLLFSLL